MNIQPITGYQCCSSANCAHNKIKTPTTGYDTVSKPPKSDEMQDRFEKSDKIKPDARTRNRDNKFGVMFSSGGGTN